MTYTRILNFLAVPEDVLAWITILNLQGQHEDQ